MYTIYLNKEESEQLFTGGAVCIERLRQEVLDHAVIPAGHSVQYLVNWEVYEPVLTEFKTMQGLQCYEHFFLTVHFMNVYRYTKSGLHEPKLYIITIDGLQKVKENLLPDYGYSED